MWLFMKKVMLLLAALICLQMLALAVPDSVMNGPYNISFDIGFPLDAYTKEIKDPVQTESLSGVISTKYSVKIQNKTGLTKFAQIDVTRKDKADVLPSESDLKLIMNYAANELNGKNVETSTRSIDGTVGGILSLDYLVPGLNSYIKMYSVMYYPEKESAYTSVIITSVYPWDDGTLSLLKSIHIDRNSTV